jgi:hypothetical protein
VIVKEAPNHSIAQKPEQTMEGGTYCADFQLLLLTLLKFDYQ